MNNSLCFPTNKVYIAKQKERGLHHTGKTFRYIKYNTVYVPCLIIWFCVGVRKRPRTISGSRRIRGVLGCLDKPAIKSMVSDLGPAADVLASWRRRRDRWIYRSVREARTDLTNDQESLIYRLYIRGHQLDVLFLSKKRLDVLFTPKKGCDIFDTS